MWHAAATVSTSASWNRTTSNISGTPPPRAMSAATGASWSILSSTTAPTRWRSTWRGCLCSTGSKMPTPPPAAILAPSPRVSLRMARAWQADFARSSQEAWSWSAAKAASAAPRAESCVALPALPTMRLASASKAKGSSTTSARWSRSTRRRQGTPPCCEMRSWFGTFWHMLESAPHADLRKSALAGCIFMPCTMAAMPPWRPMTSFSSALLKARAQSRSHAASSRSARAACWSIIERKRRRPSRAMRSLFASSRDRIASTPQHILRLSTWWICSRMRWRISWTRFRGDAAPTIMAARPPTIIAPSSRSSAPPLAAV
mmetsp:Transcript_24087/g.82383  ORF Transcript_24087/g.82383 Transcript_24087/m.82383 type:complete len:317 (+) Transcript_24087:128-1078(+)